MNLEDLLLPMPPGTPISVAVEECPRRIRIRVGSVVIADSKNAVLVRETGRLPVYYIPRRDVRTELLVPSELRTSSPHKGDASYWSVAVEGERTRKDAVWQYTQPRQPELADHLGFYWNEMDAWYEEDEEVFVHARDPYARVDAIQSSRHVVVKLGDVVLADTRRPVLLFETGLPVRHYIPKIDVRMDLLRESATTSVCPYKGKAGYWDVVVGSSEIKDGAWGYYTSIPECPKIAGLVCFFREKLDFYVDGELSANPVTPWS